VCVKGGLVDPLRVNEEAARTARRFVKVDADTSGLGTVGPKINFSSSRRPATLAGRGSKTSKNIEGHEDDSPPDPPGGSGLRRHFLVASLSRANWELAQPPNNFPHDSSGTPAVLFREKNLRNRRRMNLTERKMSAWPEPASYRDAPPTAIKYCRICQRETSHQVRSGRGALAVICIPCLYRVFSCEPKRDSTNGTGNPEFVSRSQLLLQYLLALDGTVDDKT